jgi:dipeptidyl aminopeptidase/acylaminoacyl peptidase
MKEVNNFTVDTAFTERYMGLPNYTDNYRGYEDADVTRLGSDLKDKKFFVIHGTADIDVHHQHTLYLTKALVKDRISFNEQVSTRNLIFYYVD